MATAKVDLKGGNRQEEIGNAVAAAVSPDRRLIARCLPRKVSTLSPV